MTSRPAEFGPGPLAPAFVRALRRRAEPDGFVPFDRFMEVALYAPEVGYYAAAGAPPGPTGDFYTAVHVHPVFARTVAARALRAAHAVGDAAPFAWIEIGPGDGTLSAAVAAELADRIGPERFEAILIDRSATMLERAGRRLTPVAEARRFRFRTAASIAEVGPVQGFVFANELLDAQPVRRFRWSGPSWEETGFRLRDAALEPAERPVAEPPAALGLPAPPEAGTIVERSTGAEAIVREVADHLAAGEVVLADYGADAADLMVRHPNGTLAAVHRHRSSSAAEVRPGEADLSAFVAFDRIRSAATRAGLRELAYRNQAEALVDWGLERLVGEELAARPDPEDEVRLRLAVKNLLFGFPTFRVLELAVPRA